MMDTRISKARHDSRFSAVNSRARPRRRRSELCMFEPTKYFLETPLYQVLTLAEAVQEAGSNFPLY